MSGLHPARARRAVENTLAALAAIDAQADPVAITRARLVAEAEAACALRDLTPATYGQRFVRIFRVTAILAAALIAALVVLGTVLSAPV